MKALNKYEKLAEFIAENYTPLNDWIYFNATTSEDGNVSLNTIQSEKALNTFNDGSKEVEFLFAIAMIKQYDVEMSSTNIDAIHEVDNFIKWLDNLDELPNICDNVIVNFIEVLDSVPTMSVDTQQNLAKYQFNCKMNYLEER